MSNKPIVIRIKRSNLAVLNLMIGTVLVSTYISLIPSHNSSTASNLVFTLYYLIGGIAFIISGILLFVGARLGLYVAGLLYGAIITVLLFTKVYGLANWSSLDEYQQRGLQFGVVDILGTAVFGLLLYLVYRLLRSESVQPPAK